MKQTTKQQAHTNTKQKEKRKKKTNADQSTEYKEW